MPGHSLRQSSIQLILIVTILSTLFLSVASWGILGTSFFALEKKQLDIILDMLDSSIQNEKMRIGVMAADYGVWDETLEFVQGNNAEYYYETNIADSIFDNLSINLFLILDQHHRQVVAKEYFPAGFAPVRLTDEITRQISNGTIRAPASADEGPAVTQIIINGRLVLVGMSPVTDSQGKMMPVGTLIMARVLSNEQIAHLGPFSEFDTKFILASEPEAQTVLRHLTTGEETYVQPLDEAHIAGYHSLKNAAGETQGVFGVITDRDIFQQGRISILYFTIALMSGCLLLGFTLVWALEHRVLSRLELLVRGVSQIGNATDPAVRIHLHGDDELSALAERINQTFEALQQSTQALRVNQDRLHYEATHDLLTEFSNRVGLLDRIHFSLARMESNPAAISAILFCDMDQFKLINDSYDHEVGDRVLVAFSQRLRTCLRIEDFVARLGGDEFAVLLEDLPSRNEAMLIAERILSELRDPAIVDDKKIFLSVSIGIAFLEPELAPEDLLRNADLAMYRAKANGRSTYAVFDDQMHALNMNRLRLENELRQALDKGEFCVYYQPIVNLKSESIVSFEALLRWQHPERGLLYPGAFLDVAEETGLIVPVTLWVIGQALHDLSLLFDQGLGPYTVSVNLPSRLLQDESILGLVSDALEQSHLGGAALCLEITEGAVMVNLEQCLVNMNRLKEKGVHLSVDDFGTGYSSLSYLKQFPVDSIKIDRSFISDLQQSPDGAQITKAIVAIGQVLNLRLIAEGVESAEQRDFLLKIGCEEVQGFYYSPAVPFETLNVLCERGFNR